MLHDLQLLVDVLAAVLHDQVDDDRGQVVRIQLRALLLLALVVRVDLLGDFLGDVDDGFEFGDGRAAFAELVDQFQALRVGLDVAILFNALVDL